MRDAGAASLTRRPMRAVLVELGRDDVRHLFYCSGLKTEEGSTSTALLVSPPSSETCGGSMAAAAGARGIDHRTPKNRSFSNRRVPKPPKIRPDIPTPQIQIELNKTQSHPNSITKNQKTQSQYLKPQTRNIILQL